MLNWTMQSDQIVAQALCYHDIPYPRNVATNSTHMCWLTTCCNNLQLGYATCNITIWCHHQLHQCRSFVAYNQCCSIAAYNHCRSICDHVGCATNHFRLPPDGVQTARPILCKLRGPCKMRGPCKLFKLCGPCKLRKQCDVLSYRVALKASHALCLSYVMFFEP